MNYRVSSWGRWGWKEFQDSIPTDYCIVKYLLPSKNTWLLKELYEARLQHEPECYFHSWESGFLLHSRNDITEKQEPSFLQSTWYVGGSRGSGYTSGLGERSCVRKRSVWACVRDYWGYVVCLLPLLTSQTPPRWWPVVSLAAGYIPGPCASWHCR